MGRKRVGVFIDYQNAYRGARRAFHDHRVDPHYLGQFDPLKFGEHLAGKRALAGVHIYRGLPSGSKDPRGYSACRQQISVWRSLDPRVHVHTRPLRYRTLGDGQHEIQEKGIDVQLAIDFVRLLLLEQRYTVVSVRPTTPIVA